MGAWQKERFRLSQGDPTLCFPHCSPWLKGSLEAASGTSLEKWRSRWEGRGPELRPARRAPDQDSRDSDTARRNKKVPQILSREQLILFKLPAGEAE